MTKDTDTPTSGLGDAAALIAALTEKGIKLEPVKIGAAHLAEPDRPQLVTVAEGRDLVDLRKHLDTVKPVRRKGTDTVTTVDSLIAWTNRHKDADSVVFLSRDPLDPKLTTVANFHAAGAPQYDAKTGDPTARFGDHRALYQFPISQEWSRWTKASGKALSMAEFGEFLEDNAHDLLDPTPLLLDPSMPADKAASWEVKAVEIAKRLRGRFGTAAELTSLGREFTINENTKASLLRDRTGGADRIMIDTEHTDGKGAPISIPTLFLICVPIFDRDVKYPIVCRLIYRTRGGNVLFSYSLYTPELYFNDAINGAVEKVKTETALTILEGAPGPAC